MLSPYKRIRCIEFAELPKTVSGKIRRVELRGLTAAGLAAGDRESGLGWCGGGPGRGPRARGATGSPGGPPRAPPRRPGRPVRPAGPAASAQVGLPVLR
ncbi:hypothetical protein ADK53_12910, partial [Streptomyces sp. WM6373]